MIWSQIFNDFHIIEFIDKYGLFQISAKQLKSYKEPRLITKFDCSNQLPEIMKDYGIHILPNSRGTYLLGHFNIFHSLPNNQEEVEIKKVSFPYWVQSIKPSNIQSEAVAISSAEITTMFKDFFGEDSLIPTVSGRMKSGTFDFKIRNTNIYVNNSQIEIDGSLEGKDQFILIEGKNILHDDFNVRQLYYPYRRFLQKINKPIKTLYLQFSNGIYRLLEYRFNDPKRYDSIELVKECKYCISPETISMQEVVNVFNSIKPDLITYGAPFIQCDSFSKLINIVENLELLETITEEFIYKNFNFTSRQANYYYNGVIFLGLAFKFGPNIYLTELGKKIIELPHKERQLALVKRILQHRVLYEAFDYYLKYNSINQDFIKSRMDYYNVCGPQLYDRRSLSVASWIKWILSIIG